MSNELNNREVAIQLSGVKKMYKLGQIGGGTLHGDLESWWARIRGKEDPNTMVGTDQRVLGQTFMALNDYQDAKERAAQLNHPKRQLSASSILSLGAI